jgi:hypothetical protein
MANFIEVPAQAIEGHLSAQGFSRTVQREEVVYVRSSQRNPDVKIKVYTSIRVGRTTVRGAGKDAVRVCVVFDNGRKSFGIGKFPSIPRVHSVESVLRRTDERLRLAKLRAVEWMKEQDARFGRSSPAPVTAAAAMRERIEEKAEFARRERVQEEAGFMSDPDIRSFLEREDREDGHDEPPPGFCEEDRDPCSEPPERLQFNPALDDRFCAKCQTQKCPDGCCCAC